MISSTGNYSMLNPDSVGYEPYLVDQALRMGSSPEDVAVVYGTEERIRQMAADVRLGHAERERRAARRRQQKASRRKNR